ncbi:MAG: hypothetical protein WA734_13975 [Candidatus Acidiferrales bacterium]
MPQTLDGLLLLGWMEKAEAVSWLQEHCWFDPQLTQQQAEDLWEKYHIAVEAMANPRQAQPPQRRAIPISAHTYVKKFLERHRGQEVLDVWNIDPRNLVVYQFYVAVDRSDHHAKTFGPRWVETCLQIDRPASSLPIRSEGNTIKLTLPHGEHGLMIQPDGAFRIQQGAGFVSLCQINGRTILKAGYHRSFAAARAMNAPDAKDTSLLVALTATAPPQLSAQLPMQGLKALVLGSRPPLFSDFLDDSLAIKVKLRKKRYEAHIRFEQVNEL